ncbi:MAG: hypothetical protein LBK77_01135 [Spirochaetaceae bacterium]|nr:hypothetical protein [Spirochaetaceae bacterium]
MAFSLAWAGVFNYVIRKYKNGGVLRRDFENYGALEDYLKQFGYDITITKNATAIQDNIILESAIKLGSEFTGYNLLGNQRGTFAGEILSTPGSGWKFENHASIIPNNIGAIFYKSNQDSSLNFLNTKYKNGFLLDVGELNIMDIK